MNKDMLAYIAGLFDTDGSVGVYTHNGYQSVKISIVNKHYPVLKEIGEFFGYGSVLINKRNGIKLKSRFMSRSEINTWIYAINNRFDGIDFLMKVYPFLIVKKEKAKKVLELLGKESNDDNRVKEYIFPYCAGFIDGDGCICFSKCSNGQTKEKKYLSIKVGMYSSNKSILEIIKSIIGIGVIVKSSMYCLLVGKKSDAKWFLERIIQYLRIKKDKATLLLDVINKVVDLDKALALKNEMNYDFSGMPELKFNIQGAVGERNGFAKFTSQQVRVIRDEYATTGVSIPQLAKKYNVSRQTMFRLIKNFSYSNV